MPRYSVIAADTLRDLVTLTFDLLTLVSGHTWLVTWSTPPPSLKILRLSVLELRVLTSPIGYHCQERAGHLEARFQGEGVVPCQCIDTTRKAIDCATTLPPTVFI